MAGNIQSISDNDARQLGEWVLARFEKLPGMTKVTVASIPQGELARFGKDVLQQIAQQYSRYVTTAGMGGTSPSRTANP